MIFKDNEGNLFDLGVQNIGPIGGPVSDKIDEFIKRKKLGAPTLISYTGDLAINSPFTLTGFTLNVVYITKYGAVALYKNEPTSGASNFTINGISHPVPFSKPPAFAMYVSRSGYTPTHYLTRVWITTNTVYILVHTSHAVFFIQYNKNRITITAHVTSSGFITLNSYNALNSAKITEHFLSASSLNAGYILDCRIDVPLKVVNISADVTVPAIGKESFHMYKEVVLPAGTDFGTHHSTDAGATFKPSAASNVIDGKKDIIARSTATGTNLASPLITDVAFYTKKKDTKVLMLTTDEVGIRNAAGPVKIIYDGNVGTLYGKGGFLQPATWPCTVTGLKAKQIPWQEVKSTLESVESTLTKTKITDKKHDQREIVHMGTPIVTSVLTYERTNTGDV